MVIIDKIRDKKYLVRDRFGKKPLYYFLKENILYFSSELKALTNFIKLEVDKENLAINFISNLNPEPLTPYKGIFSVLPGNLCIYKNKSIETFRWYSPKILENNSDNINEIEKKFYDLASSSIDLRLRSDVPVGVFLSGGIDSNLIFNLAFKKNKDLCAYICNIPNKKEFSNSTTDVAVSKKICEQFKCEFKEITFDLNYLKTNLVQILYDYDLLISGTGHLIFHALSKAAKKNNTKVILTGSGGDEISGGYYWQKKAHKIPNTFFYSKKISFSLL